jgi:hypothetical protein
MPAPATPQRCSGCTRWADVITTVVWGDRIGQLCATCAFYYKALRLRPESRYLHWESPE